MVFSKAGPEMYGTIKNSGTFGDVSEVPGKRLSSHPSDGGEKPLHGSLLQRYLESVPMVRGAARLGRWCSNPHRVADQRF